MIPQSETLQAKLRENQRRLHAHVLGERLEAIGLSGLLNDPKDVARLNRLKGNLAKDYIVYPNWSELRPEVERFAGSLNGPIILAPFSFEDFGVVRLGIGTSLERLFDNPRAIDLDGFWLADSSQGRLVDIDGDHFDADVWYWQSGPEIPS